jgi:toxin ParE1/3/4
MSRIEMALEVGEDFERILDDFVQHEVAGAAERLREIIAAIDVLATNPLIGRPARGHRRELVIGRRTRGYVALYRYASEIDMVFVLALRRQREAGYKHD